MKWKIILLVWLCLCSYSIVFARNANLSDWCVDLTGGEPEGEEWNETNAQIIASGSTIHVLWVVDKYGLNDLRLMYRRSLDSGKTFQAPVEIMAVTTDPGLKDNAGIRMAVAGTTVHIISQRYYATGWHYELEYYRSVDNGASFEPARILMTGADAYHIYDLKIAADDGGVSIGVRYCPNWYDAYNMMIFNSNDNGDTFTNSTAASSADHDGSLQDLVRNGDDVYALYYHMIEDYFYGHWQAQIWFSGSNDGGQTFNSVPLSTAADNSEYLAYTMHDYRYVPHLTAFGDSIYAIWAQNDTAYDSDDIGLYFARSVDKGASFSTPQLLANTSQMGRSLQVGQESITAMGNYVYVMFQDTGGTMFLKRSDDKGVSFKSLQTLTQSEDTDYLDSGWWPVIKADPSDATGKTVYALWTDPTLYSSRDGGETFTDGALLGPHFSWRSCSRPNVAIDSNGVVHCLFEGYWTWYSTGVFGDSDIFYRKYDAQMTGDPVTENRALHLTTYRNEGDGTGYEQYDTMQIPGSDAVNFKTAMTIETWIRPNREDDVEGYFVYKGDAGAGSSWGAYMLGQWRSGQIDARIATTDDGFVLIDGDALPNNVWTHVAMTYDASGGENNFKIYANGNLAGQMTATGELITGNGIAFIGGDESNRYRTSVDVDELRFWNRALTQNEIFTGMTQPLQGTETGLTAYYDFNNELTNLVPELTGNAPNGVLTYKETLTDGFTYQPATGVRIDAPAMIHPGEMFSVMGYLDNGTADTFKNRSVFFALQIYDEFWFWPQWLYFKPPSTGDVDFDIMDIPPGTTPVTVLPEFEWPDTGSTALSGIYFLGAMLNESGTDLEGNMAYAEWGFGPS